MVQVGHSNSTGGMAHRWAGDMSFSWTALNWYCLSSTDTHREEYSPDRTVLARTPLTAEHGNLWDDIRTLRSCDRATSTRLFRFVQPYRVVLVPGFSQA